MEKTKTLDLDCKYGCYLCGFQCDKLISCGKCDNLVCGMTTNDHVECFGGVCGECKKQLCYECVPPGAQFFTGYFNQSIFCEDCLECKRPDDFCMKCAEVHPKDRECNAIRKKFVERLLSLYFNEMMNNFLKLNSIQSQNLEKRGLIPNTEPFPKKRKIDG